ncbi:hypothetical protein D3C73_1371410 [compost metagenome]
MAVAVRVGLKMMTVTVNNVTSAFVLKTAHSAMLKMTLPLAVAGNAIPYWSIRTIC